MVIGILGAMPEEIESLQASMQITETVQSGIRTYFLGVLEGHQVVLSLSRIGKVAAASTVSAMIHRFGAEMIVFTGVAGAAGKHLRIGDMVIADFLVQHDMDASALPPYRPFEIPGLGQAMLPVPASLLQQGTLAAETFLQEVPNLIPEAELHEFSICKPVLHIGTIASGDQFIANRDKVFELSASVENLKCLEMEGAAVAQVCAEHGIPCLVFRVISDHADEHAPMNFARFVEKIAAPLTGGVVRELLRTLLKEKPPFAKP